MHNHTFLSFLINKWLQINALVYWAFNEIVNAWGLTSVTVRLPRSKIQKQVSESVSRGPWYGAIFTNLERVLSEAWGTRKAEMKMSHLTLRAGRDKRLEGFSTSDSSRSVLSWEHLMFSWTSPLSPEKRDSQGCKHASDFTVKP